MSIQNIAKSLGNELIKTKEYKLMSERKKELFSHTEIGKTAQEYEKSQIQIINSNLSQIEKQNKISQLQKHYFPLLNTKEMKNYISSVNSFQNKIMSVFNTLNTEIYKIINR